jgi:hypothetical protein
MTTAAEGSDRKATALERLAAKLGMTPQEIADAVNEARHYEIAQANRALVEARRIYAGPPQINARADT